MPGHSLFAPSSAATWLECSYSARNAVPEAPKPAKTVAAANEGTRAHTLLEAAISNDELPHEDDEKADAIALGMSFINQLEPGETYAELRGELTPECGGTTDLLRLPYDPHVVTVFDAKFGKWDVDAYHNKQLLTYAAMHLNRTAAPWFRLVIFQPFGLDEDPFKQWVAHRSEVEAHRARVLAAIADCSPPKPGPQCRWCKAFQSCTAMTTDAGFVMGAMTRDPATLTPDELVRLLRLIRALGDVKAVYEDVLTTKLKLGYAAAGAALKPGRAYRAWNDDQQAAQVLYSNYGARGIKPLSPAQAEKLGIEGKKYAAVGAHKPEAPMKAFY